MATVFAVAELVAACFLCVVGVGLTFSNDPGRESIRYLLYAVFSAVLMSVLDSVAYQPVYLDLSYGVRMALITFDFIFALLAVAMYHLYLCATFKECGLVVRDWVRPLTLGVVALLSVVWIALLPTDFLYVFTETGADYASDTDWIIQVPLLVFLVSDMVVALRNRDRVGAKTTSALVFFLIMFLAAGMAQGIFASGMLYLVMALCLTVCYVLGAIDQNKRMLEQEASLAKSKLDVALSQIQPHFLYNSLNSIYHLIDIDPEQAQEVLSEFSTYLRVNLNSVSKGGLVPFSSELEHIRTYLRLEKLRFGDDLNVEECIEAEDFLVPPLGIQPLVENAVKHGVCKREEGGTVRISSRELKDCWEVVVTDDGVGFDVAALHEGKRGSVVPNEASSGIGVSNVSHRLAQLCGATLTIQSEPGKGTLACVRIPKEGKE